MLVSSDAALGWSRFSRSRSICVHGLAIRWHRLNIKQVLILSVLVNQASFPHQGHIKDEPVDEYERVSVHDLLPPEHREDWANPSESEELKQTL